MKQITFIVLVMLCGCATSFKSQVNFNPSEPLRVAVLPFGQVDKNGVFVEKDPSLAIDKVGLISSELREGPAHYVQTLVQDSLRRTGLDLVSPQFVEAALLHNGFGRSDNPNKIDYDKIWKTDAGGLCVLLACDALLYGKLTRWDRSYYAIQSVATVGIDVQLTMADNRAQLFTANAIDSTSRGFTKGPTGFSDLVIEPIKGLSNDVIIELAHNTVEKMMKPLYNENRPEFLNSPPPALFASAHDADNGQIRRSRALTVVALGSPGGQASFSIGQAILDVPMVEKDRGHYIGEYYPLKSDAFNEQPVYTYLTDQFGRVTKQKVGRVQVSLR